jgi:CBS domain-containing protein
MEVNMKVSELMHEGVLTAQVSDTIRKVAMMMKENDIGSLPVFENDTPAGFVTDRDIVMACAEEDTNLDDDISAAMSPEVISVSPDKDITEAARIMEDNQISRLLVMEGNQPMGIITLQDLSVNIDNPHLKAEVIQEIKQ